MLDRPETSLYSPVSGTIKSQRSRNILMYFGQFIGHIEGITYIDSKGDGRK